MFGFDCGVCGLGLIQPVDQCVEGLQQRFDQRRMIPVAGLNVRLGRRLREGIYQVQIEIASDFLDDLGRHGIFMVDECTH